ncbi:MAG: GTPase Era [Bacteroidota bacterium]
MSHKSGYAAIIGKPNAGKSTLMNAILGEKLSIATSKPQTTRKKILGIHSTENFQIIFLDTPGIMQPEYLLQNRMQEFVFQSAKDADVILFILDIEADPNGTKAFEDVNVQKVLHNNAVPKILLINKIDVSNQAVVEKLSAEVSAKGIFNKVMPISAKNSVNIVSVVDSILEFLPEHPKYYTEDQLSNDNERFFVSEIIREKVFELYREEIPYSTEIEIEEFTEREGRKDYIRAAIIIERESQKPIIIGNKGSTIKKLGKSSREAIESFLQREVFLELFVKVKEKWRSNPNMLNRFGYKTESDD